MDTRATLRIILVLCLMIVASATIAHSAVNYTCGLDEVISNTPPDQTIRFVVFFDDRIDTQDLAAEVQGMDKIETRQYVIERLQENLEFTASDAIAWIENEAIAGNVTYHRSLWILNAMICEMKASRIPLLEQFDEVVSLRYDVPVTGEGELDNDGGVREYDPVRTASVQWGVEDIGAPELWALGFEGRNAIAAFMDSGCNIDHDDLQSHIWINPNEIPNNEIDDDNNTYVDDSHGWNFVDDDNNLTDVANHGTKVAGVIAGDGTHGDSTGIAPKARLMVLRIYEAATSSESRNWEAEQYAMANGADVVSNSLSYKYEEGWFPDYPAYVEHRYIHEVALIFGMIQANSTGNSGGQRNTTQPIPWNVSAPANCPPPWLIHDQNLIGGLTDVIGCGSYGFDRNINPSSDYGPSEWDDESFVDPNRGIDYRDYPWIEDDAMQIGLLKPDVTAPSGVRSTSSGGGYATFNGTSAANPHLGGALTLLRSIHQQATPAQLCEAIKMSAQDAGPPGHDNRWGAGKVRVDDAHEYLEEMLGDNYGGLIAEFVDDDNNPVIGNFELRLNNGVVLGFADDMDMVELPRINSGTYQMTLYQDGEVVDDYGQIRIVAGETQEIVLNAESGNAVPDVPVEIPETSSIASVYPNPFNAEVSIQYTLPTHTVTKLVIFDINGREVASLVNSSKPAGAYSINWNASDFASGIYMAVLETQDGSSAHKLMLLK
ncbi:S8 family peptidase [bacterium]|nr:S8 family peptidase [bacterium]